MRPLRSPSGKPRTLDAVRPSLGLEATYRAKLLALLTELNASLNYWLIAQYRRRPPRMAEDTPARDMANEMRRLARRWKSQLDEGAPELAKWFATATVRRSDARLKEILQRAGIAIEWQPTRTMQDVLNATLAENTRLIRSIAEQHLSEVEGIMQRAYQRGSDLGVVTKQLSDRFGIAEARAATIARTQNSAATAMTTAVRQIEIGATEAIWQHSHAGREPRPSHVANNGCRYNVETGWLDPDEGQYIWPGTLVNCRCVSKTILPGT